MTQTWQSPFLFISNSPVYPGSAIPVSTEELSLPRAPKPRSTGTDPMKQELAAQGSVCQARKPLPQQEEVVCGQVTHAPPSPQQKRSLTPNNTHKERGNSADWGEKLKSYY